MAEWWAGIYFWASKGRAENHIHIHINMTAEPKTKRHKDGAEHMPKDRFNVAQCIFCDSYIRSKDEHVYGPYRSFMALAPYVAGYALRHHCVYRFTYGMYRYAPKALVVIFRNVYLSTADVVKTLHFTT
jgi:hypothetical protein